MHQLYESYQQGYCQEVYDELLGMGELTTGTSAYEGALAVVKEMMKRIRFNLEELLIPRLKEIGYRFGDGSWDHPDQLSEEELARIQQQEPIFQPPSEDVAQHIVMLEGLVGPLPLSLKCWYEEVGAVNLIGSFHSSQPRIIGKDTYKCGYGLDPLYTQPLVSVIEEMGDFGGEEDQKGNLLLPISPDGDFKYGYSGGGDYAIEVPCQRVDGLLRGEEHQTTFVNYLHLCFHWGGCPGLAKNNVLTQDELAFLRRGLLPF